jgi:hypothetical protein
LINKAFDENTLRKKDLQPIDLKGENASAGIADLRQASTIFILSGHDWQTNHRW